MNYLGLLIGPKGTTQRQLSESTGAKIVIRGMGNYLLTIYRIMDYSRNDL